jgi:predicted nucleic acid-binding protein
MVDAPGALPEPVCSDPDDDKFLACAVAAGAPVVVSGDAALLKVSGWNGIDVLKPRTFVDRYLIGPKAEGP